MKKQQVLFFAVFVAGLCSIIYELLISATATYFLGNGVLQFSILIGVYLFSMGIGAYLSQFFKHQPISFFVLIEYVLGFIGGISVPLLYFAFIHVSPTTLQILSLSTMFVIGLFTGMEVPLITYINQDNTLEKNISNVLSLDYVGGLIATLIFPFLLLPFVGLFYSSLIFGIVNICLGMLLHFTLHERKFSRMLLLGIAFLVLLILGIFYTGNLLKIWEEKIYKRPIIENIQTPYQKIVITKNKDEIKLFLNRALQFSSLDEHRYHEMLVHVPMLYHPNPRHVLILGGGENLAAREVLKHPSVLTLDVVDIDATMFDLSKTNKHLVEINEDAGNDERVRLIVDDAFTYLKNNYILYDVIISDLPDPSNDAIAKLYSKQFFMLAKMSLQKNGLFVTQSGEINYSNLTFNCIKNTVNQVFEFTHVYHTTIPSFGNWGFTIAADFDWYGKTTRAVPKNLKYLDDHVFSSCFVFPKDIAFMETKISTIDNPVVLSYFLEEWERWKIEFTSN